MADLTQQVAESHALAPYQTGVSSQDDPRIQTVLEVVAAAPDAVAAALRQVLPQTLLAALQAGGEAGVAILRQQLRAAGGPGSGRYPKGSGNNVPGGNTAAERRRQALILADTRLDEYMDAKQAHKDVIRRLDIVEKNDFQNPEYLTSKQRMQDAQQRQVEADRLLAQAISADHVEKIQHRAADMAEQMHYDATQIDVVDQEPREFTVGDRQFQEAGHFNPITGRIQINARIYDDRITANTNVIAHEIAHAQYKSIRDAQAEEHKAIIAIMSPVKDPWTQEKILETIPDFEQRFPASWLFHQTLSDSLLTNQVARNTQTDKMIKDDGVSPYSEAYWKAAQEISPGVLRGESAVNETLAEVRRMQEVPTGPRPGDKIPSKEWAALASGIGRLYAERKSK